MAQSCAYRWVQSSHEPSYPCLPPRASRQVGDLDTPSRPPAVAGAELLESSPPIFFSRPSLAGSWNSEAEQEMNPKYPHEGHESLSCPAKCTSPCWIAAHVQPKQWWPQPPECPYSVGQVCASIPWHFLFLSVPFLSLNVLIRKEQSLVMESKRHKRYSLCLWVI